jgi:hypothetical protein
VATTTVLEAVRSSIPMARVAALSRSRAADAATTEPRTSLGCDQYARFLLTLRALNCSGDEGIGASL